MADVKSYCYFDVTIGGEPLPERIVMELFDTTSPKTCENFRKLCTGNDGKCIEGTSTPMTYRGSKFHRIIKDFMIQGGDYTNGNGTGGYSIYGPQFDDEAFEVLCDRPGLLAMANRGPNTNGSQFFITTVPCKHLSGKHVVFGKVLRGMNTVRRMEAMPTGSGDVPQQEVVIADCGVLDELPAAAAAPDGDALPDFPQDCTPPLSSDEAKFEASESIRQLGNTLFGKGELVPAVGKYEKALRYLGTVLTTSANENAVTEKKIACWSNMAMCHLKLAKWTEARNAATEALKLDPAHPKALYRRGVALMEAKNYEEAERDFVAAQKVDPNNAQITEKIQEVKKRAAEIRAKQAATYKKMFS